MKSGLSKRICRSGAAAHFKVEGKWNDDLMTQVKAPSEIPTR